MASSSVEHVESGRCLRCGYDAQLLRYPAVDGTIREVWVHVGHPGNPRPAHFVVSQLLIEEEP